MNHFPLWFPNANRSELFPPVTVMRPLAQVLFTGLATVFTRYSVKKQVKRMFLKTCLWVRNIVLKGKIDAPPSDAILWGSQEALLVRAVGTMDLGEAQAETCFLLPTSTPPQSALGCFLAWGLCLPWHQITKQSFSWWWFWDCSQWGPFKRSK